MKSWDSYGRTGTNNAQISGGTNFFYKTCQPAWTKPGCPSKGVAYAGAGGACTYVFGSPRLSEVFDSSDLKNATGVNLQYTSTEDCTSDASQKATYNITLMCGDDDKTTLEKSTSYGTGCNAKTIYKTKMGCYQYQIPLGRVANAIAPFLGAVLIIFGALMAFAGAKFLFVVISFVIGFVSAAVIFGLTYNLFIDPSSKSGRTWTVILLVVSVLLAILVVFFTYKFT